MQTNPINQFYGSSADYEWSRLAKDSFHKLEFNTTMHFLKKYLPSSGLILDAGGGPGRYTIELAKLGYHLVLLDITPELLEKAKRMISRSGVKRQVSLITQGSITDLSRFADNNFDAVICLGGPLSHVSQESDRIKAVSELARVTKKGEPICISVMGRLGVMIKLLKYWPEEVELTDHFRELWQNGDDKMWRHEYYCHFFLPEEIEQLVTSQNLKIIDRVGLEGLAHFKEDTNKVSKRMPQAWKNWLESHYKMCGRPAVFATSDHMLVVARK